MTYYVKFGWKLHSLLSSWEKHGGAFGLSSKTMVLCPCETSSRLSVVRVLRSKIVCEKIITVSGIWEVSWDSHLRQWTNQYKWCWWSFILFILGYWCRLMYVIGCDSVCVFYLRILKFVLWNCVVCRRPWQVSQSLRASLVMRKHFSVSYDVLRFESLYTVRKTCFCLDCTSI